MQRAHHVEHAAAPGDDGAIALLDAAASELQAPAPATAARFDAAALRLLPDRPDARPARAHGGHGSPTRRRPAGDAEAARDTLLAALRIAPDDERLALTVALANQEWWLGEHEDARRRLHVALADLPAEPSPDRIRLRLALGLMALLACDLDDARPDERRARRRARDRRSRLRGRRAGRRGASRASSTRTPMRRRRLEESAAALERLTPDQLATRLPALWMHGRAHRVLGRFDAALAPASSAAS